MPEIKHNFTGGKMNKDLDERLVPNGQYRDAMNIQVSTSEGSEVGTAQNILGNSLISGQGFIPSTASCVGSIADEKNDKLYYFVVDSEEVLQGIDLVDSTFWASSTSVTENYTGNGVLLTTSGGNASTPNYPSWRQTLDLVNGQTYKLKVKFSNIDNGGNVPTKFFMAGISSLGGNSSYRPYYNDTSENIAINNAGEYTNVFTFNQSLNNSVTAMGFFVEIVNGSTYQKKINVDSVSLTTNHSSYIIEYNSVTNSITPVVVDTTGGSDVLKFDKKNIITGVNIIDDLLFWTDNHSEPKKINIHRCIQGTDPAGSTHTKLINESRDIDISSNIDLEEKHITVIRKSPRTAPTIELISGQNAGSTYSGVMRITTDPGGLVNDPNATNVQNASSLWFSDSSIYNHLYDFSTLTVGDRFLTNIETDIDGNSGFTLDWNVGDTVVFKEFSGDTYEEAPSIPITDYTIKAKILSDNNNDFSDIATEFAPNNDFTLPNINGSKPFGYTWTSGSFDYNSLESRVEVTGANWNQLVVGTPIIDFVQGGIYKVKVKTSGITPNTAGIIIYIVGNNSFPQVPTPNNAGLQPYWYTPTIYDNGDYEFDLTLNLASASQTAPDWDNYTDKFFVRTIATGGNTFTGNIDSISIERQDVADAGLKFEVLGINGVPAVVPDGYSELRYAVDLLDEEENLFEFKFPRFAYRYQYEDKEYSAFSPFTQVAFLPGSFDFHPQKGYNLGMTNGLKKIKIKNFIPYDGLVDDVVAVDILYKDEASSNIYVIDTIKNNQYNSDIWSENEYTIKSESVKRVLPSKQLLRPWDAVPKKALAQEISGNRIIYGNYTQGFDLFNPNTKQEYYPDFNFSIQSEDIGLNTVKSIKSLREYQLGVVFIDKYGRETPVLSNASGLDKVPKIEAAKGNKMEVSFNNTVFPEEVEYFKFFVKETSGEYYNMTMDRWWEAGDGLAWLSFGSADINKIDIDTFLILKKGVESNDLVTEPARYKVLAIETEAPDYIKTKKTLIEEIKHTFVANTNTDIFSNTINDAPLLGRDTFKMRYQPFASGPGSELHNIEDGILYVEFVFGSVVSERYRITELTTDRDQELAAGGVIGPDAAMFSVKLDKNLGEDVNFICDDPNDGLNPTKIINGTTVRIYKYTPENSSEFDGRFFVKVISDGVFIDNIATTSTTATQYRTTVSRKLYFMGSDQAALHSDALTGQTLGIYQNASGGTGYQGYSGGGTNDDLGFGSFASFFRNYKYTQASDSIGPTILGSFDVGQYRFDDTSESEWKGELVNHMDNVGIPANNPGFYNWSGTSLKNADHSGFDANERYGLFNNNGEQTKGSVWFIDGGPFTGDRSSYTSLHWDYTNQNNGVNTGVNYVGGYSTINIAMGGIYNDGDGDNIGNFWKIGLDSAAGGWYSGQKFKDLVDKISPSVKFRFKEDPLNEVYTIRPSGVAFRNLYRWSDGGTYNPANVGGGATLYSGEYPWGVSGDNLAPALSPNYTRGYQARFTNDRTGDGTIVWDPTNSGATGAIPGGLRLTAEYGSYPLTLGGRQVFIENIHDITCSQTGGKHSITKGMILTSYGGTILDGTFTSPGSTNSHEPLIVSDIVQGQGGSGFVLTLTGYSSPILVSGNLANTGLLKHKVFVTSPEAGDDLVFQQPAMNGYSQYSVNRINAQDPNNDNFNLNNPALLAVGYTIEFLEEIETESEFPDNPAIWETEPKDSTDLDIYYEASGYNPLVLTEETINFVIPINSGIIHVQNPATNLGMSNSTDAAISAVNYYDPAAPTLGNSGDITGWGITIVGAIVTSGSIWNGTFSFTAETPLVGGAYINIGDQLLINKPDGSSITVTVKGWNFEVDNRAALIFIEDTLVSPNTKYILNWHNCYSFGNGVESNRIRDTYNLAYIANGVKASTTLDENPYEENLKYGLIYSDIYNGAIGINNLNQFIAAEKITKNINPTYGSIQKLKAGWGQGGDLITLCEDRVLKILANKDALFNADGDTNLTSTNNVLGQAIPYSGEYGISKNPESFASEAYRAYFTDKVRGAVMRLSMDGLTPISNAGMKDWFKDNLKLSNKLIGSYDDKKEEYNISLKATTEISLPFIGSGRTVSYKEGVKGWVSFKSFVPENALSTANNYYTVFGGKLYKHHVENVNRNTFYNSFTNSSLNVLLNDIPSSIKSYHTLEYEGSQSRIVENLEDNDYYNLTNKNGWHVSNIETNKEKGSLLEFIEKEGKWFNYIKGVDSDISSETDFGAFDIQGIGTVISIKIAGCTDSNALNYNANATTDDGSCFYAVIPGCTDSTATNYNPLATIDNGSCTYPLIAGCTDSLANNYNPNADIDNGSCTYTVFGCTDATADNYLAVATVDDGTCTYTILGCTDVTATNYNALATVDDGTCIAVVLGCTNPLASNYNPSANTDDGTCVYPVYGCTDSNASNYMSNATIDDGSCTYAVLGCTDPTAINYLATADTDDGSCLPYVYGCTYQYSCTYNPLANYPSQGGPTHPNYGTGPCQGNYGCTDPAYANYDANADCDNSPTPDFYLNYPQLACSGLLGCTDPTSDNYDASATVDDGSCVINGCTDPTADNYDATANTDDGSCIIYGCTNPTALNYDPNANQASTLTPCIFPVDGCTDPTANNYDSSATTDDGSCTYDPLLGSNYQGGIVFYLDGNGGGLIAALNDQSFINNNTTSGLVQWGCYGALIPGANGTAIGTGEQNTIDIVNNCGQTYRAAAICANLTLNGYSDWFLPSQNELLKIHQVFGNNGLNTSGTYWSSTQYNILNAYGLDFNTGNGGSSTKNNTFNVRAIRAF